MNDDRSYWCGFTVGVISVLAGIAFGLAAGCATPLYERGPLAVQRLAPHLAYPGELVSQVCRERKSEACVRWDLMRYDLRLEAERVRLNAVKLECDIAGRRFAICLDRPGYCYRERQVTKRFLGIPYKWELAVAEYIPAVDGHQRLLDAAAECASQDAAARGFVGP